MKLLKLFSNNNIPVIEGGGGGQRRRRIKVKLVYHVIYRMLFIKRILLMLMHYNIFYAEQMPLAPVGKRW